MAGLTDIDFATDDELTNYESEVVVLATDRSLSLDKYRALAMTTLRIECAKDGIDETAVDETVGDGRTLALRDYATRLVLYYLWRDLSAGRDDAVTTAKARLARDDAEAAALLFQAIGWPITGGGATVVKDVDALPRLVKLVV